MGGRCKDPLIPHPHREALSSLDEIAQLAAERARFLESARTDGDPVLIRRELFILRDLLVRGLSE